MPRPQPLLLACMAPLLAQCSTPTVTVPSLAPRAAEAVDPRVPVPDAPAAGPADAALAARLADLVAQARSGDSAFVPAAAEARRLAGIAGAPGGESWVVAEQALSVAVAARGPTTRALGDIDALAASRIAEAGGMARGNLAAVQSAQSEVAAIDRRQTGMIEQIAAMLAR